MGKPGLRGLWVCHFPHRELAKLVSPSSPFCSFAESLSNKKHPSVLFSSGIHRGMVRAKYAYVSGNTKGSLRGYARACWMLPPYAAGVCVQA